MEKTPNGINVTVTTTMAQAIQQTEYINVPQGVLGYGEKTREMDTRHGTLGDRACI